jgi:hypothetical protein
MTVRLANAVLRRTQMRCRFRTYYKVPGWVTRLIDEIHQGVRSISRLDHYPLQMAAMMEMSDMALRTVQGVLDSFTRMLAMRTVDVPTGPLARAYTRPGNA